jgi:hypothetical protein
VKDSALPLTIGDTSGRGKSSCANYHAPGRLRHVLQESAAFQGRPKRYTLSAKHYDVKMNAVEQVQVHQFVEAFMLLNEQAWLGVNASGLWKFTDVSEYVSPPGGSKSTRIAFCEFIARSTATPCDVGHTFLWIK